MQGRRCLQALPRLRPAAGSAPLPFRRRKVPQNQSFELRPNARQNTMPFCSAFAAAPAAPGETRKAGPLRAHAAHWKRFRSALQAAGLEKYGAQSSHDDAKEQDIAPLCDLLQEWGREFPAPGGEKSFGIAVRGGEGADLPAEDTAAEALHADGRREAESNPLEELSLGEIVRMLRELLDDDGGKRNPRLRDAVALLRAIPPGVASKDLPEDMKDLHSPYLWNRALAACRKGWHARFLFHALRESSRDAVRPNLVSYNTYLTVLGQSQNEARRKALNRDSENVLDVLKEMRASGIEPDVTSYNCALFFCRAGDFPTALELWNQLKVQKGLSPETKTYNAMLTVMLRKHGDPGRAVKLLREMEESGVPRDSWTFHTLMDICRWGSRWDIVSELEKQALAEGVDISRSLHLVTVATARSGDWKRALQQLEQIGGHSAPPQAIYATIRACGSGKQLPIALRLFEKLEERFVEAGEKKYSARALYHATIAACKHAGEPLRIPPLLAQMEARGVSMDAGTVTLALSSLGGTGETGHDALRFFRHACELGIQPTAVTKDRLIDVVIHHTRDPADLIPLLPYLQNARGQLPARLLKKMVSFCEQKEAWDLILDLRALGPPSVSLDIYEATMRASVLTGRVDEALAVLLSLGAANRPVPTTETFNKLIEDGITADKSDFANEVLRQMDSGGFSADLKTIALQGKLESATTRVA